MNQTQSVTSGATSQDTCLRCNGLMVPGNGDDQLPEVYGENRSLSWRCVNCGEWVDSTIMTNRRSREEKTVAVPRR